MGHVPSCLLVPNVRLSGSESSGVHPGGLLHLRHHFQVRSGFGYLSDLVRQVWKESTLAVDSELVIESLFSVRSSFHLIDAGYFLCLEFSSRRPFLWLLALTIQG